MAIYVAAHRNIDLKLSDGYKIISVGGYNLDNYDYKDNTLDNISNKNESFCELTALYWIYKNIDEEVVGLSHYRRFFMNDSLENIDILTLDEAEDYLSRYDIILPTLHISSYNSIYEEYVNEHLKTDIDNVRQIIQDNYFDYLESFDYIMNSNKEYGFNMFVSRKKLVDDYCNWLFNILFSLEKITDINKYDSYQKRMYGFIAERLFTVWVYKNKLNVKELPVRYTEFDNEKNLKRKIKKMTRDKLNL